MLHGDLGSVWEDEKVLEMTEVEAAQRWERADNSCAEHRSVVKMATFVLLIFSHKFF